MIERASPWRSGLCWMLAQQQPRADPIAVVVAVAALILVVVGAGLAVMHLRKRLLRKGDASSTTSSWLDELRTMHRTGQLSDEEFQAARASLLARITGGPIPPSPVRPVSPMSPTARVAPPGFDLTGAPLPRPIGERPDRPAEPG